MKKYIAWALVLVGIIGCSLPSTPLAHADTCVINSFDINSGGTQVGDYGWVKKGESISVSWATSGCSKVEISGGVGVVEASGTKTITPAASLYVSVVGTKPEGGTINKLKWINVLDPADCTVTMTSDKASVYPAESFYINFTVRACSKSVLTAVDTVTGVALRDPIITDLLGGGSSGGQPFNGLKHAGKFTFKGYIGADVVSTVEVTVASSAITPTAEDCAIKTFALDKTTIATGESTTARWATTGGCDQIVFSDGITNGIYVGQTGTKTLAPTALKTYNYTLYAQKIGASIASDNASVALTVTEKAAPIPTTLAVTTPNGGETIKLGQPYTITWKSTGIAATEKTVLSLGDDTLTCAVGLAGCSTAYGIVATTNTGSYVWNTAQKMDSSSGPGTIPVYAGMNKFRIKVITYAADGTVLATDASDSAFTITDTDTITPPEKPDPTIVVVTPTPEPSTPTDDLPFSFSGFFSSLFNFRPGSDGEQHVSFSGGGGLGSGGSSSGSTTTTPVSGGTQAGTTDAGTVSTPTPSVPAGTFQTEVDDRGFADKIWGFFKSLVFWK